MRQLKMIWPAVLVTTLVSVVALAGATAMTDRTEATVPPATSAAAPAQAGDAVRLDGAKVFAANCGACHSERYPKERSDGEWGIIVMHMKVRANLTSEEAKAVLNYLKGNN